MVIFSVSSSTERSLRVETSLPGKFGLHPWEILERVGLIRGNFGLLFFRLSSITLSREARVVLPCDNLDKSNLKIKSRLK